MSTMIRFASHSSVWCQPETHGLINLFFAAEENLVGFMLDFTKKWTKTILLACLGLSITCSQEIGVFSGCPLSLSIRGAYLHPFTL